MRKTNRPKIDALLPGNLGTEYGLREPTNFGEAAALLDIALCEDADDGDRSDALLAYWEWVDCGGEEQARRDARRLWREEIWPRLVVNAE